MHVGKTETLAAIILARAAALAHAADANGGCTATANILVAAPTRQAIHTLLVRVSQRKHHFFRESTRLEGVAAGGLQMPSRRCLEIFCVDSGFDKGSGGGWNPSSGRFSTSSASNSRATPQQEMLPLSIRSRLRAATSAQKGDRLKQLEEQGIKVVTDNGEKGSLLSE
jgi:hypothetical protein